LFSGDLVVPGAGDVRVERGANVGSY